MEQSGANNYMQRADVEDQIGVLQQAKRALEEQIKNHGNSEEAAKRLDELQKKIDALTGKSSNSLGN
jgi:hypothetical protein